MSSRGAVETPESAVVLRKCAFETFAPRPAGTLPRERTGWSRGDLNPLAGIARVWSRQPWPEPPVAGVRRGRSRIVRPGVMPMTDLLAQFRWNRGVTCVTLPCSGRLPGCTERRARAGRNVGRDS